jgi:hypothetical protein
VVDLRRFPLKVQEQRRLVERAAAEACTYTALGGLDAHLAMLMDTTGWANVPTGGVVTYEQDGTDDSIVAVRQAIGTRLAASARWVALGEDVVRVVPFGSFVSNFGGGELAKSVVNFTINQARGAAADAVAARWGDATGAELDTQKKIAGRAQDNAEYALLTAVAAHPTLLVEPLPDSAWSLHGRLLSPASMGGFGSQNWADAKLGIANSDTGAGDYFVQSGFDAAYEEAFFDIYPPEK